jgi:hypothetical protein
MIKLNQSQERIYMMWLSLIITRKRIKSEFLHLESKSDRIEFQILNMSQYFGHNFQLNYRIEVIHAEIGNS